MRWSYPEDAPNMFLPKGKASRGFLWAEVTKNWRCREGRSSWKWFKVFWWWESIIGACLRHRTVFKRFCCLTCEKNRWFIFFGRWWPIWWHTKCVVHCEVPRGSEKCWSRMSKVGFETWGLDVCPFFRRMTKLFFPSISHDWTETMKFRLC
jgi:hypothetical protein